ncbi:DNA topoisomerase 1 beta-like [Phragmites australis]|uniref:DNA topoisomerase 1 beta-like n=1 Tax=Phragmites australis TaxID=29695 RepID=UPI002D79B96C|nr:DNA topoisomerase 1 beta-like [Phragmites australis]XP_062191163.1 DNA topoisomerase 1 beta-like [Phragmites australis]XP_062191164.1 DNA topoisomerase 1 beta-like [Phragmites australis]XP_062191165.1 DNA topoisomerase 1 beta-like [Phragmites australis]XP_062191166.1 DNA topoisomerase 1 beta-like [Phragmites australis]
MAIVNPNPVMFDDDDDEAPISFKRSSTSVKPTPSKQEGSSGNARPVRSPKPVASNPQKNGVMTISRPLQLKPQSSSPNNRPWGSGQPNSSAEHSSKSNNIDKSKLKRPYVREEQPDDSDDDKPIGLRRKVEEKKLNRVDMGGEKADDSDEDHKPLSLKIKSSKMPSNSTSKAVLQKTAPKIEQPEDDSDDDKPLASRLSTNAAPKSGGNVSDDSEDEKPLAARFLKVTGSVNLKSCSSNKGLNNDRNGPQNLGKRPLDNNNQTGSSLKKAKPSNLATSASVKRESKADDNDNTPLAQRLKMGESSKGKSSAKNVNKKSPASLKKDSKRMKTKMKTKKMMKNSQFSKTMRVPPGSGGGQKWTTLEHNGVIFPPPYKSHGVKMLYNGQPVDLTPEQEEVATMFAVMKDTEYATKKTFIENFFNDWRKILGKNHIIKKFELCDFTPIYEWHLREKEKKKQMTSEEKKALREDKLKQEEKYMWAVVDGLKEKVGNFRVEPPGLFRGRGEHPKMGKLKRRIQPSDITINIGKGVPVPECPIPGESWKEVKHDNTVTWLAFWNDPISQKDFKYVFLAASSALKGQSDKEKYEKSRKLKGHIQKIRDNYTKDFKSKDPTRKQIAVATYLIDKLALRAGNEKDDDEADTVGCCTLKVDNVTCMPPNKLQFDFLGKDSIRYFNTVEVEQLVYKAIEDFRAGKKAGEPLFDKLDTTRLNAHLKDLMPGLTAKVFRTYNASITLDDILHKETEDGTLLEKIAVYQRANKEVAIICNHQRAVSKSHDSQMTRMNEKIDELKAQRDELKVDLSKAKKGRPLGNDKDGKAKRNLAPEGIEKKITTLESKIEKMEMDKKIKEDLKTVALGTSKINYLDPRITVAWCKRHEVPIEKIFNKSLIAKFGWAMDVDPEFRF